MTNRETLTRLLWLVLLSATIIIWGQFVPARPLLVEEPKPPPLPQPELKPYKSMVICPFFGPCWRDGRPIKGAL